MSEQAHTMIKLSIPVKTARYLTTILHSQRMQVGVLMKLPPDKRPTMSVDILEEEMSEINSMLEVLEGVLKHFDGMTHNETHLSS